MNFFFERWIFLTFDSNLLKFITLKQFCMLFTNIIFILNHFKLLLAKKKYLTNFLDIYISIHKNEKIYSINVYN